MKIHFLLPLVCATLFLGPHIARAAEPNALPTLSVANAQARFEGTAAVPGFTTFAVVLSTNSSQTITVRYQTVNGVVNGAVAGSDFIARSGTLTFVPGELAKTLRVDFIGESVAERNETMFLDIKTPTNATIADSRGSAYIKNDDGPGISIDSSLAVDEGDSNTTPQDFTVRLSTASSDTITVEWSTANNTAGPADYVVASGKLTFAPGETSKTITVFIKGDTTVEPNETYRVNLVHPTFAILTDSQGVGTIRNDDTSTVLFEDEPSS